MGAEQGEIVEMYLKSIYLLGRNQKGLARTGDVSRDLEVAPSSVTEMFEKLKRRGLVSHRKYHGARLTRKGAALARKVLQKHCTVERFMVETLGYKEGTFHDEACRLEHVVSDETQKRLESLVGAVKECPDCYDHDRHHCSRLFPA